MQSSLLIATIYNQWSAATFFLNDERGWTDHVSVVNEHIIQKKECKWKKGLEKTRHNLSVGPGQE